MGEERAQVEHERRLSVPEVRRARDARNLDEPVDERPNDGLLLTEDAMDGERHRLSSAAHDVAHWVESLNAAGVPAGPVLGLAEVFADPQVRAREMLVSLPHPELGTFHTTGLPVKLSATPGAIERRPPLHGEHGAEVLREAGYSLDEIEALAARGVVKLPPRSG